MLVFQTAILKFSQQGEKTGWSYIPVSSGQAEQLMPGQKKSFRVKGKLDGVSIRGMALLPMGDGSFILALKANLRKALGKSAGAMLQVQLEADAEEPKMNADFLECLNEEPEAFAFFQTLAKGHQRYFSKWIEEAKTDPTKIRRIAMAVNALQRKWGFPEMIRAAKKKSA